MPLSRSRSMTHPLLSQPMRQAHHTQHATV